jgi:hypothetical protein
MESQVVDKRVIPAQEGSQMVFVPAVAVGGFVVFAVGSFIMYAAIEAIVRWRKRFAPTRLDEVIENHQEKLSLIGGGMAVLLLLRLLITSEWSPLIWFGLTGLGILGGILTFVIWGSSTATQTKSNDRPPATHKAPPRGKHEYRPPAPRGAPPIQGDQYRPPAPTSVSFASSGDPYRDLIAKARYDQALVDRLIENERRCMPYASLDDLCRSIIAKWGQDNH